MANFFKKLIDGPQYFPICVDTKPAKTCMHKTGCKGSYNNAEYTYRRDIYTGEDCGGYKYVSCGCYF